ncbi:MAG: hypothetical protein ACXVJ7_18385 [Acidimicrobiia bacterium]
MARARRRPARRRVVLVVATATGTLGLVACNGSGDPSALSARTTAEHLARFRALTVAGHAARGTERRAVAGTFAAHDHLATASLFVEAGTAVADVQYRRIGGTAWIRRAVLTTSGVTSYGAGLLVFRGRSDAPFAVVPRTATGTVARLLLPYDPIALFRALAHAHVELDATATTGSRRHRRTTFSARLSPTAVASTGLRTVSVVVGGGVPREITVSTVGGLRVHTTIRVQHRRLAVAPPDAAAVAAPDRPLPDALGPYTTVATLPAGATPVTIQRAEGRDGWSCWKVASSPGFVGLDALRPSGGVCVPPVAATGDPSDRFEIALDATDATPYELLGIAVPAGTTGAARLEDGTTRPLAAAADLLVDVGPARPATVLVTLKLTGGGALTCGPGAISSPDDIADATVPGAPDIRSQPWNCLPADPASPDG